MKYLLVISAVLILSACEKDGKVENAAEVVKAGQAEVPEELPDGPRPETRHILHGSGRWNIEGIRAARIKGDGPIEVCAITGEELYYIEGDTGMRAALRTSFVCTDCKRLVGEQAMQMNGADKSKYPVIYLGAHCVECWPNKKG